MEKREVERLKKIEEENAERQAKNIEEQQKREYIESLFYKRKDTDEDDQKDEESGQWPKSKLITAKSKVMKEKKKSIVLHSLVNNVMGTIEEISELSISDESDEIDEKQKAKK